MASSFFTFRPAAFNISNQTCRHQPNRSPMKRPNTRTKYANETLNDLNKQIKKLVVEDKRTKWQFAVDKCDHRSDISQIWRLDKGLTTKSEACRPNTLLEKKPNVLGVTPDTQLTFKQYCNNIAVKVQQSSNILKELAGSTLGFDEETLLTTYQAIGRSVLGYCCPVWTPSHKDTIWSRHQLSQNSALRIATGNSLKTADVAELRQEARELQVRQHNELISQKFGFACQFPQHPCHQLCLGSPDDRSDQRRSLIGRF